MIHGKNCQTRCGPYQLPVGSQITPLKKWPHFTLVITHLYICWSFILGLNKPMSLHPKNGQTAYKGSRLAGFPRPPSTWKRTVWRSSSPFGPRSNLQTRKSSTPTRALDCRYDKSKRFMGFKFLIYSFTIKIYKLVGKYTMHGSYEIYNLPLSNTYVYVMGGQLTISNRQPSRQVVSVSPISRGEITPGKPIYFWPFIGVK